MFIAREFKGVSLFKTIFIGIQSLYNADHSSESATGTHVCGAQSLSHVWLSVTPWTGACQAPLSLGFSRQGNWSGLPCPPPGDLPNPGPGLPHCRQITIWATREASSFLDFLLIQVTTEYWIEFPVLYSMFSLVIYFIHACMHAKWLHSCPTLCDPMDWSPQGSSVHWIFQARTLKVGCHVLLQGIFFTQGSNLHLLCLLHWQVGSLPVAPPGKPILCIVVYICQSKLQCDITSHWSAWPLWKKKIYKQ